MNTKLDAVTDENGRPIRFFMTAGGVSDYTGAVHCQTIFRPRNGFWLTGVMMQIGFVKPYK